MKTAHNGRTLDWKEWIVGFPMARQARKPQASQFLSLVLRLLVVQIRTLRGIDSPPSANILSFRVDIMLSVKVNSICAQKSQSCTPFGCGTVLFTAVSDPSLTAWCPQESLWRMNKHSDLRASQKVKKEQEDPSVPKHITLQQNKCIKFIMYSI